jgi:G3E family GTPase
LTPDEHNSRIPVTLIAGFLGAGKTTLLNHILSGDHGVRAAVLVNDFGAINIDSKLIVDFADDTVELANGCVCCTIRDDLVGACIGLLARPDRPEHVFVELSGVSDPGPVLNSFLETDLAAAYQINGILSVVDAEQLPRLDGEMAQLARHQLRVADIVVLNKTDLVSGDLLAQVRQLVQLLAPGSRIIEAVRGRVPIRVIFDGEPGDERLPAERAVPGTLTRHGGLDSWSWTSNRALSLPRLRSALEHLPETAYRCKGVVQIEEMPRSRYVLQMVGKRYHLEESGHWDDQPPRSEIVLIGGHDGLDAHRLQETFDACLGTGDDSQSPVLRLVRKLAPQLLTPTATVEHP